MYFIDPIYLMEEQGTNLTYVQASSFIQNTIDENDLIQAQQQTLLSLIQSQLGIELLDSSISCLLLVIGRNAEKNLLASLGSFDFRS